MSPKQRFKYWRLWRSACRKRHWDEKDSDLRHQVHREALGQDKSHLKFTNGDLDRIYRFMELLIDPDNLAAVLFFQQPEQEQKKRLVWSIERLAARRYIESISDDRFGTIYYSNLGVAELEQLRNTIKARMRAKRGRVEEATPLRGPHPVENAA
jgi:hypothetical protein